MHGVVPRCRTIPLPCDALNSNGAKLTIQGSTHLCLNSMDALLSEDGLAHYGRRRLLQESPRVLGVGVGVFLLGFFLVVCVVLALLGSRTTKPGLAYAGATTLYGIIAVILLASPKGSPPAPSPVGYDETIVPLVLMIVLVSLGAAGSIIGLMAFHVKNPIYARPLSYHIDILNQQ